MPYIYNDKSPMPFGKYKGKALANVPPEYLLYIYENNIAKGMLRSYIEINLQAIKQEILNRK